LVLFSLLPFPFSLSVFFLVFGRALAKKLSRSPAARASRTATTARLTPERHPFRRLGQHPARAPLAREEPSRVSGLFLDKVVGPV
jgi:hypothetical protein